MPTQQRLQVDTNKSSYAWADCQTASEWHLWHPRTLPGKGRLVPSSAPLSPAYHLISVASRILGFVLDPEMAVPIKERASVESQLVRLAAAPKSVEGAFADYVRAMCYHSSVAVFSDTLDLFVDHYRSMTILMVPSTWSDGARAGASRVSLHSIDVIKFQGVCGGCPLIPFVASGYRKRRPSRCHFT